MSRISAAGTVAVVATLALAGPVVAAEPDPEAPFVTLGGPAGGFDLREGGSAQVPVSAGDPQGDSLSYVWEVGTGAEA